MSERHIVCLTCGRTATDDPFENRLGDGQACPSCRDRILESLPALLPRTEPLVEEEEPSEEEVGFELPSDGWKADSTELFDHLPGKPPEGPIGA